MWRGRVVWELIFKSGGDFPGLFPWLAAPFKGASHHVNLSASPDILQTRVC